MSFCILRRDADVQKLKRPVIGTIWLVKIKYKTRLDLSLLIYGVSEKGQPVSRGRINV